MKYLNKIYLLLLLVSFSKAQYRPPPSGGSGSGTVTNVSSANSRATVANQSTTPVITIVSSPLADSVVGQAALLNAKLAKAESTLYVVGVNGQHGSVNISSSADSDFVTMTADTFLSRTGKFRILNDTNSIRIGSRVMSSITTAHNWVGIGNNVFDSVTTGAVGRQGVAIGGNLFPHAKMGQIGLGFDSGDSVGYQDGSSEGLDNISIGWFNFRRAFKPFDIVAMGYSNFRDGKRLSQLVGLGEWVMFTADSLVHTVAIGEYAGAGVTDGVSNVFVGDNTLSTYNPRLNYSTIIGADPDVSADAITHSSSFGYRTNID